jgi:D-glycero-D-manno-heptose 1,7-bisphosphate phosphatase
VLTGKGEQTRRTGGLPPGTRIAEDLASMVDAWLSEE